MLLLQSIMFTFTKIASFFFQSKYKRDYYTFLIINTALN